MVRIFVPVSDDLFQKGTVLREPLVPFSLDYLQLAASLGRTSAMPADWISDNDYAAARKRLEECQP